MAKEKMITNAQLKKALSAYSQSELITLITEITKVSPQAKEFLTIKFTSRDNMLEVLEKYKSIVQEEFYPKRGFGRLNLREAKKAITDFKKICNDKAMIIDIMLFYVENCVEFTNDFGDIYASFYNSACSMFASVVKEINSSDKALYDIFAERLRGAAENAVNGWGFRDFMMDTYYEIYWLEDEAEE